MPAAKARRKKVKKAEAWASPTLGSARRRQACDNRLERLNTELGAGARLDRPVRPSWSKTEVLIDVALFLRDKNPIKYDLPAVPERAL